LINGLNGGAVPTVDTESAKQTFLALHRAIQAGTVAACHDLSEGGLAVAAAEMAFAGGFGAELQLDRTPRSSGELSDAVLLFSESNTRFLCEVSPAQAETFEAELKEVPHALVGNVVPEPQLRLFASTGKIERINATIGDLKAAWQRPLGW